jgi:hypothetical protein
MGANISDEMFEKAVLYITDLIERQKNHSWFSF